MQRFKNILYVLRTTRTSVLAVKPAGFASPVTLP
jgi:hypothetical protein